MATGAKPGDRNGEVPPKVEPKRTFDQAAARYHRARPRYPEDLMDSLFAATGLGPGSHVVEVGCASGVATEQLASRGVGVTGVELGAALAVEARTNLARFPKVVVVNQPFESWAASASGSGDNSASGGFDAVVAATAWHWLDAETKYELAHRVLAPGGWLAFWSARHVFAVDGDPLFEQLQPWYDRSGAAKADGWVFPRPGELTVTERFDERLFREELTQQFDWEISYTAAEYIDLLLTFSDHIAMAAAEREELFAQIRSLVAQRPDGRVRRHWGAVLQIARAL